MKKITFSVFRLVDLDDCALTPDGFRVKEGQIDSHF